MRMKPINPPIVAEYWQDECANMRPPEARFHSADKNIPFPFSYVQAEPCVESPNVELSFGRNDAFVNLNLSAEGAMQLAQQLIASAEFVEGLTYNDYAHIQYELGKYDGPLPPLPFENEEGEEWKAGEGE